MSKTLLSQINGNNNGAFKRFLDTFTGEPNICWYPSAGSDFRALFYLHPEYDKFNPGEHPDTVHPDLFIFTDYYPWDKPAFLDNEYIFKDDAASLRATVFEELPGLHLPLHPQVVHFPEGSAVTNRAVFMEIEAWSDKIGTFTVPLVYLFVENESFYEFMLRPSNAHLSQIIHIRYGSGFGGSNATGAWILNVLKDLHCKTFISDGHHDWQSGDKFMYQLCESFPRECEATLTPYRTIPEVFWSNHGDVVWYEVS